MKHRRHRLVVLGRLAFAACAASLAVAPAVAGVVDFEDLPAAPPPIPPNFFFCATLQPSIVSGGFSFSTLTAGNALYACDPLANGGNTTHALTDANAESHISMSAVGGGAFGLTQFDAGSRSLEFNGGIGLSERSAVGLRVTGLLSGGGTVVQEFAFDGTTFTTFTLSPGFDDLLAVDFLALGNAQFTNPEFLLDNVVTTLPTSPVPEPSSSALAGAALLAAALLRRRRQRTGPAPSLARQAQTIAGAPDGAR